MVGSITKWIPPSLFFLCLSLSKLQQMEKVINGEDFDPSFSYFYSHQKFSSVVKEFFSLLPHLACVDELFFFSPSFSDPSNFKSVLKTIVPLRNNVPSKLRMGLRV